MYTMTALESAIRTNPQPLLLFAALKDFSGENISFLTKVLDWKRAWSPSSPSRSGFLRRPSVHEINNKVLQRQQFKQAVDIYASHVSLTYSDYPVNLSHAHLKDLESIFEGAASILHSHKLDYNSDKNSAATPFDIPLPTFNFRLWSSTSNSNPDSLPSSPHHNSANTTNDIESGTSIHSHKTHHTNTTDTSTSYILQTTSYSPTLHQTILQTHELPNTNTNIAAVPQDLPSYIPINQRFGPDVFDRAEESIKYMVLTNTWPKFVNAGYASVGIGIGDRRSFLEDVRGRLFKRKG